MRWRQWWSALRYSKYGDVPFVLLGVLIGWNCDVSCAVKGVSMVPTLNPGEYILFVPYTMLQVRRWFNAPLVNLSDVVVVKVSDDLSVCKRVVKCTSSRAQAEEWGKEHYVEVMPAPYSPPVPQHMNGDDEDSTEMDSAANSERAYFDYVARNTVRSKDWDSCIDRIPNPSQWIWLEGDNKSESFDSRRCGPVPVECIRGLVLASIWPSPHALQRPPPPPRASQLH
ncbi:mitochondrial inner membrane signal peptidase [Leishmania donovani]|uniref:Mitochondrial_inner_membrane_signal_peptidase_-_putative n=3 Tax=Leishmania donovani species complex TaxID=38574 RepID=A0A6L0XR38_LEIIN|nr:putative mitochondrial inner membrane signal peptidase [Leishmania infantum JPCM5]TPP42419.1 Peptidase S24-like family protein [Leishmania donovani]CAC9548573.1 mitochondrial_inner_membrane_signal_peptidase_-_putative [Leishmania infantum]CAJ1993380.1 mitochondrial inner membrane signal peptidase [Leishmania donovani]CAM72696.1 putative mitochondrial inner membrane signal peptidase [Leishmania infantum JPCM5]SUZ46391.1 mitochondrial_inner_membrane_signal_peptidase_-_putative [Leishmania inf|eukprot:XP_001469586.1 putative mitochondrial inner membrane signal peptidase [Leishmania infantum JPCM5]